MADWLKNRSQRVVLNGNQSDWKPVGSGVPQGSVLGPVLFLIYINDLGQNFSCRISKFADDTKLGNNVTNYTDYLSLQHDLDKALEWAKKWGMSYNVDKCKVIHIEIGNPNLIIP
ncbi:MAG: reverse transcriptase domain-containing protein, partial [Flammeovirgaceae bacterium]